MKSPGKITPDELGRRLQAARRKTGNITQAAAAEAIGVARTTMVAIERGERKLKPHEIIKLAELYRVSCNSLLRETAIHADIKPRFRQHAAGGAKRIEAAHILQQMATSYVELEQMLGKRLQTAYPPEYSIRKDRYQAQQAEDLALEVRTSLGLGLAPITDMLSLLESEYKIRVFVHKLPPEISGAFVYLPELDACILINAAHGKGRQAWSAAHELAHFLTERTVANVSMNGDDDRFADLFAAAFLMPAAAVRKRYREIVDREGKFSTVGLVYLAHAFHVSFEAITRRLENLIPEIPNGLYESQKARGLSVKKAFQTVLGKKQGPPVTYAPRYTLLAIEAWQQELVTEAQLAEMFCLDRIEVRELLEDIPSIDELDFKDAVNA